jgi:hypothetical protein
LKKTHFNNPAGEQVVLDEKMKLEAEYDIINVWNFPKVPNFHLFPEGESRKVFSICST